MEGLEPASDLVSFHMQKDNAAVPWKTGRRGDPGARGSHPGAEAQKREAERQQCPLTWARQSLLRSHLVRVAKLTSTHSSRPLL